MTADGEQYEASNKPRSWGAKLIQRKRIYVIEEMDGFGVQWVGLKTCKIRKRKIHIGSTGKGKKKRKSGRGIGVTHFYDPRTELAMRSRVLTS